MANDFLTPMQYTFLQRFFNTDFGQRFFLTGGTALAVRLTFLLECSNLR